MWSSNHFSISSCFPCFSESRFFRVQVFQGAGPGSEFRSRIRGPGPGFGSSFQKQPYRQPIIDFQGSKSKGTSQGMYVKILVCSKCWKNSTSTTASSPMPSIFQMNLVFLPTFLLPRNNFQLSQLSTDLFNSNNRLSVVSTFREKCQR